MTYFACDGVHNDIQKKVVISLKRRWRLGKNCNFCDDPDPHKLDQSKTELDRQGSVVVVIFRSPGCEMENHHVASCEESFAVQIFTLEVFFLLLLLLLLPS